MHYYNADVICPVCERRWTLTTEEKDDLPEDGYLTCSGCLHDAHGIELKDYNGAPQGDPNQLDLFEESDGTNTAH